MLAATSGFSFHFDEFLHILFRPSNFWALLRTWTSLIPEWVAPGVGGGGGKSTSGGRILGPNGGEGAQQYDQKLPCPLPKILQPFMTQSPCDPPTAHHTTLVILFLRETTQSEAWVDFARHYGTVFAPHWKSPVSCALSYRLAFLLNCQINAMCGIWSFSCGSGGHPKYELPLGPVSQFLYCSILPRLTCPRLPGKKAWTLFWHFFAKSRWRWPSYIGVRTAQGQQLNVMAASLRDQNSRSLFHKQRVWKTQLEFFGRKLVQTRLVRLDGWSAESLPALLKGPGGNFSGCFAFLSRACAVPGAHPIVSPQPITSFPL